MKHTKRITRLPAKAVEPNGEEPKKYGTRSM